MALSLFHLLELAVARYPDRPAVGQPGGTVLSYSELDSASARVAAALGTRRGDRVGLLMPKSVDVVVGIWGILRTGAAYVPIDPTAPPARAAFLAANCELAAVLVSPDLSTSVEAVARARPEAHLVELHGAGPPPAPVGTRPDTRPNPRDLAYVLYTSGSSGTPKGVMISHAAALAFVEWAAWKFGLRPDDVLSNHAPFHFDLSTFDLFAACAAGAKVVVLDEETARFPARSTEVLESEAISVWYSVPGALRRMLGVGGLTRRQLDALRVLLFAGEVCPPDDLRRLQRALPPGVLLFNLYGPTETNVCTYWRVPPAGDWNGSTVPIGVDCESCEGVIVDPELHPVGAGEQGELLVRGGTLMSGYWGDPERTRKSFVSDFAYPHLDDRFYRTGDIVSRGADGVYVFHGRRDSMVKIRGYRVELGEVEAVLHQAEGVAAVAVVTAERGEGCERRLDLVAFVEAKAAHERPDEFLLSVKRRAAALLPRYMVPAEFRLLPRLPQTSSGKTDRQSLTVAARASSAAGAAQEGDPWT